MNMFALVGYGNVYDECYEWVVVLSSVEMFI